MRFLAMIHLRMLLKKLTFIEHQTITVELIVGNSAFIEHVTLDVTLRIVSTYCTCPPECHRQLCYSRWSEIRWTNSYPTTILGQLCQCHA